jgi:hypothetical protein
LTATYNIKYDNNMPKRKRKITRKKNKLLTWIKKHTFLAAAFVLLTLVGLPLNILFIQQKTNLFTFAQAVNLVRNPGCETNTNNWVAWQGSLSRTTSTAFAGTASCLVKRVSGVSYTMDDSPATVSYPAAGSQYTATAWVKTGTAVGKPAQIVLRQSGGSFSQKQTFGTSIPLTTAWQQVSVSTTIDQGRTSLEVYIVQNQAVSGNSMNIDEISLTQATASTPTPTITVQFTPSPTPDMTSPSPTAQASNCGTSLPTADSMNANTYPCRLFATTSAWNSLANGLVDPKSDLMVTSGDVGSLKYSFTTTGRGLDIAGTDDYPNYGVPFYYADNLTPRVAVTDSRGWWGGYTNVPIPPQAKPAVGTDMHLSVWDVPNNMLYEFWEMQKNTNGSWSAGFGAKFASNGLGYNTAAWTGGARAYGGSLIAGSIRYQEMVDGEINHAVGMAYPWTLGKKYAMGLGIDGINYNIATHSDNATATNRNTDSNIPEGSRLRLKSTVDVNAKCGTNRACKIVGTAMKTYGIYVVDTAGVATLYAEVLTGKNVSWSGLLHISDVRVFTADDFELVSLPATLTQSP